MLYMHTKKSLLLCLFRVRSVCMKDSVQSHNTNILRTSRILRFTKCIKWEKNIVVGMAWGDFNRFMYYKVTAGL